MRLAACGKEIYAQLFKVINEGIVVTLSRQLNQIHFSLPKWEIVQEPLAQSHRYHNLLTIEEPGKKESKFLGKIVWRNV